VSLRLAQNDRDEHLNAMWCFVFSLESEVIDSFPLPVYQSWSI